MVTAATKLKDACSLKENLRQPRQHIKKQRQHFAHKTQGCTSIMILHSVGIYFSKYPHHLMPLCKISIVGDIGIVTLLLYFNSFWSVLEAW